MAKNEWEPLPRRQGEQVKRLGASYPAGHANTTYQAARLMRMRRVVQVALPPAAYPLSHCVTGHVLISDFIFSDSDSDKEVPFAYGP